MSKLLPMLLSIDPECRVMGYTFSSAFIESKRINEPDILPVRLVQITTTDLDNLTARVDHFISLRLTTLLGQKLLTVSILAGEVESNNQTHSWRDYPKRCHEGPR